MTSQPQHSWRSRIEAGSQRQQEPAKVGFSGRLLRTQDVSSPLRALTAMKGNKSSPWFTLPPDAWLVGASGCCLRGTPSVD